MDSYQDEPPRLDQAIAERDTLLGLCYRLLGSLSDAEDAVQETYIRWYRLSDEQREEVLSPRGWLIKTASRISLDILGSARVRREHYVGDWLPEPVPGAGAWTSRPADASAGDPADRISLDESVSMALLVVLESMTPAERVAFVLHDVFGYTFREVGEIVGRTPEACRQLASSARRRAPRQARRVSRASHDAVVRSFKDAWQRGNVESMIALLDPGAKAVTDGGGLVSAPVAPILGAPAVADLFLDVLHREPEIAVRTETVNGRLGLVAHLGDRIMAVITISMNATGIHEIWVVRNPEKLRAWHPDTNI
ncbi:RNA polymerase sigma factor SigJ [Myceligenerans crystallogenes]|uniref:RNA polymerase sigma factor SigJ n=1 Tax=Myceligenerans crystallogenes TaxID=316335 RepID=A0ABN2N790_9MICO